MKYIIFLIFICILPIFESAPTDQKCLLKDKDTNFCLKMANYPRKQIEKLRNIPYKRLREYKLLQPKIYDTRILVWSSKNL
uniref:Uncharacterized protein n=1 Tax=Megaselia scalaris TaxID=36166 RepID=T1H4R0_MEGSC